MQQVEEASQEHGEEPVGQEYSGDEEKGTCWRIGERCGAEVVAEVWGYEGKAERGLIKPKKVHSVHLLCPPLFMTLYLHQGGRVFTPVS